MASIRRTCGAYQRRLYGPGQLGTDLLGGAKYKYGLLWVVGLASLMAIFMQVISARLGVVTGKDLAQCCRDWYHRWTRWPNWLPSELAIGRCDLAEVLGSAVALNLLFHIPLLLAVISGNVIWIEYHVLFPENTLLRYAHQTATEIEAVLSSALNRPVRIISHLEPKGGHDEVHSRNLRHSNLDRS
jgi:NRAMP (natural resistance-associated macrophage protein)-like metal ion transporter